MAKPKLNRRQRYAIAVHLAGKKRDRPIAAFLKYWTKETRKSAKEMPRRLYNGHVSPEMIEQIFFSGDHLPSFIRPLNHPAGGRGIPPDASVEPVFSNKAIDDRIDFFQLAKDNVIKRAVAKKQLLGPVQFNIGDTHFTKDIESILKEGDLKVIQDEEGVKVLLTEKQIRDRLPPGCVLHLKDGDFSIRP